MKMRHTLTILAAIATATTALSQGWNPLPSKQGGRVGTSSPGYLEVIRRVAGMTSDAQSSNLVRRFGFDLINLTWEDTGRYKGSSVGPNISDMTIQVGAWNERRQYEVSAMPVIRYSNFSDVTGDIDPEDFTLLVGNEDRGRRGSLQRVSLREVLADPTAFLTDPRSWPGRNHTLLAPRDEKVLVSAQACFLPIPQQGIAKFNPVLFNYQSRPGDPAVLTIMATREGTSMTVIDNQRDSLGFGAVWGQRLYFNDRGRRASLTGERLSDFDRKTGGAGSAGGAGMSMVLVIQVPLKQRVGDRGMDAAPAAGGFGGGGAGANKSAERRSDTENAVIGHGETEGPFTEIDNLPIERDPRFPVRVTVQFYKATSTGVVSEADMRQIKSEIQSVYDHADSVGSLVTEGHTGRVTEYWGAKVQPIGWWRDFWNRYERDTGESREDALRRLSRLLGPKYETRPVCDLYLRDVLRRRS